jgi:chromosome segregation ATPase
VLKAKQESFHVLNEDLARKQKLIEDQISVISNLKEKIEQLEEAHTQSRVELENRLNDKETDLKTKIASFEANLYEGRQYFEEMLGEKDKQLKVTIDELNELKKRILEINEQGGDNHELISMISTSNTTITNGDPLVASNLSKFDANSMKTMKSLYEHQIELLKVKIEMLEKTCANYQQGIKEMNKSFGYQQQCDEMASMQTFKDIMQQLQKTNVQLETERIDLQVECARWKDESEQVHMEKENLNKKYINSEQTNQRLQTERIELEVAYKSNIEQKQLEFYDLTTQFLNLKGNYEQLQVENGQLLEMKVHYEQLVLANQQLTQHYEELYAQAGDIVNGNQLLNEQVQNNATQIENYESQINDLNMQIDHLQSCNSDLNTKKINLDLRCQDMEEKLEKTRGDLKELTLLRSSKYQAEKLIQQVKELEVELMEKNELIDQLNQAKEFLVENNSKLLTNNIKIQLFIESMGLDETLIENNAHVKEYDDLRNQFKQVSDQLEEFKHLNRDLEEKISNLKQSQLNELEKREKNIADLNELLSVNQKKMEDMITANLLLNQNINDAIDKIDAQTQVDEEFFNEVFF